MVDGCHALVTGTLTDTGGGSSQAALTTAGSVWAALAAEAGGLVPIEILFDRAWFGRASPIFTDDFEPGTSCRWTVP